MPPMMTREKTAQDFIDKFKGAKTTDECYTPPRIYEVVKKWAVEKYGIDSRAIVRPFMPGGNYYAFDYPDGCVVLDNPPYPPPRAKIRLADELFTAARGNTLAKRGVEIQVRWSECTYITKCGTEKYHLFGDGLLISSRKAAEIRKAANFGGSNERVIELSADEKEILRKLDEVEA